MFFNFTRVRILKKLLLIILSVLAFYSYGNKDNQCIQAVSLLNKDTGNQLKEIPLQLIFLSAEQGIAEAQGLLGLMYYYTGNGVEQDYQQAFRWAKKAAEKKFAEAQGLLGVMYYEGNGVEQNYQQAFRWMEKAAEQGSATAQELLGRMYYYEEKGVRQDYQQAFLWTNKAAEQGSATAQELLGTITIRGTE